MNPNAPVNPPQGPTPPQKLIDFNNDLKALCAKYQYELKAILQAGEQGIFPILTAVDVSPKDAGVPLNTDPNAANPQPAAPTNPEVPPGTPMAGDPEKKDPSTDGGNQGESPSGSTPGNSEVDNAPKS